MQEWESIVTQECDDGVVTVRNEIKKVAEEE